MLCRLADLVSEYERDAIAPVFGRCFYCGKEVTDLGVVWSGLTLRETVIALHPGCAQRLALHLAKDGTIGQIVEEGKSPLLGLNGSLRSG